MPEMNEMERLRLEVALDHATIVLGILADVHPSSMPSVEAVRMHARAVAGALAFAATGTGLKSTDLARVIIEDDGQPE